MLRGCVEKTRACADRCCEVPDKYKQLATSTNKEDHKLHTRLEGTAYLYMILWTLLQLMMFVALMVLYYLSKDNHFMITQDCCEATEVLPRINNDLPSKHCSNLACPFTSQSPSYYDSIFIGSKKLLDERPRRPLHGDFSKVITYHSQWWCCNLDGSSNRCCNKMPYTMPCGLVMWLAGFSAVCSVLMTQVMLQGFYSFCSRKSPYLTVLSVFVGTLLRLVFFCLMFYFFFGFMFLFIFFWYPMQECDNPYAYDWWKFGYLYVYFFFDNLRYMAGNGFNFDRVDDHISFEQLIASHQMLSLCVDFLFAFVYTFLAKKKDNKGQPYFYLTFFKL